MSGIGTLIRDKEVALKEDVLETNTRESFLMKDLNIAIEEKIFSRDRRESRLIGIC